MLLDQRHRPVHRLDLARDRRDLGGQIRVVPRARVDPLVDPPQLLAGYRGGLLPFHFGQAIDDVVALQLLDLDHAPLDDVEAVVGRGLDRGQPTADVAQGAYQPADSGQGGRDHQLLRDLQPVHQAPPSISRWHAMHRSALGSARRRAAAMGAPQSPQRRGPGAAGEGEAARRLTIRSSAARSSSCSAPAMRSILSMPALERKRLGLVGSQRVGRLERLDGREDGIDALAGTAQRRTERQCTGCGRLILLILIGLCFRVHGILLGNGPDSSGRQTITVDRWDGRLPDICRVASQDALDLSVGQPLEPRDLADATAVRAEARDPGGARGAAEEVRDVDPAAAPGGAQHCGLLRTDRALQGVARPRLPRDDNILPAEGSAQGLRRLLAQQRGELFPGLRACCQTASSNVSSPVPSQ